MMLLDRGALGPSLGVEGGRFVDPAGRTPAERLDCAWEPRVTLRPGAVNAHTHLYSGLAPLGMPQPTEKPRSFVEILQRVWWRLDRALDAASLRASARFALADALLHGTTALVDHHESPELIEGSLDVLADAAQELGVRLAVGYGATERNGGREEGRRGLVECERFLSSNRRPLVRGLVALHASFTVCDDTVREAGALARRFGAPMHVHVAEDMADVDDARERGFPGPFERLQGLEALPPGSVLAHGVHLSPDQVRRAEALGLWLVQNPRSNEGNRVGYPMGLRASREVALGTDGWPADLDEEAAALFRLGAEHGEDDEVLRARVAAGHRLASRLFGAQLGELTPGADADVVIGAPGEPPRHVLVAGRCVVRDGRLGSADGDAITADARAQAEALWRRMEAL